MNFSQATVGEVCYRRYGKFLCMQKKFLKLFVLEIFVVFNFHSNGPMRKIKWHEKVSQIINRIFFCFLFLSLSTINENLWIVKNFQVYFICSVSFPAITSALIAEKGSTDNSPHLAMMEMRMRMQWSPRLTPSRHDASQLTLVGWFWSQKLAFTTGGENPSSS